jgi:hypothetical protein
MTLADEAKQDTSEDFWQTVNDVAYAMEGESRGYERERMKGLATYLTMWLAQHPEIEQCDDPLEHFAMHAVARLANAFAFNDSGETIEMQRWATKTTETRQ